VFAQAASKACSKAPIEGTKALPASRRMRTVETAVSALTEPARLARKIASPAVTARPTYG